MPRGGKRPGAGAPRGNLNALGPRHTDLHFQRLLDALARLPEARNALLAYRRAQLREERQARRTAAALLALLIDGAPAPPPLLRRLADSQPLFAATLSRLLSAADTLRKNNQNPSSTPPHNRTPAS